MRRPASGIGPAQPARPRGQDRPRPTPALNGLTLDVHGSPNVEPSYAASLKAAAGTDARIRFRGPFAEGEQARVLAELDVLVVPSIWWENSPLVVLEALAAGLPVIASRTGGINRISTSSTRCQAPEPATSQVIFGQKGSRFTS